MPVIGFARIAGGAPGSVRSMVDHLVNCTLAAADLTLGSYYLKGAELTGHAVLWDTHPVVASGLGLTPGLSPDRAQVSGLLAGRRADGEKIDGKQYAAVRDRGVDEKTGARRVSTPIGSYDFCPQPHKSVSVAWAFAPPTEQAIIMNAHLEASRFAVKHSIIPEIAVCRLGKGGQDGVISGHVAAVEFTHTTERQTLTATGATPGDPGIHTHTLIPNAVFAEDGRVGSLHTARVRGTVFEASAVYNARLAQNLRDAGLEVGLDPITRTCRVRSVPADVAEHFSKRSRGIEAEARATAADRGEDWSRLTQPERDARLDLTAQKQKWANKGGKDDVAAFADWRRQAAAIGWQPPASFVSLSRPPELTAEQRHRLAYETALPFLEAAFAQKTTLSQFDVRSAAGWGLVETGFAGGIGDIDAVTRLFREHGIRQGGERTPLIWGQEEGKHFVSITTGLHEAQERAFITLARRAAADRSAAVPAAVLARTIRESGLDFSDAHGQAQLRMARSLATGGRFAVAIGAAGSGKTALLSPLVAAWQAQGRMVWGVAVAHQQADALTEAGIAADRVAALSGPDVPGTRTFLEAARAGRIALDQRSVVVVDELATLGTRQALELLRLRERFGFTVVAIGDDKQCASIEAGAIVELSRRALGSGAIPEILTTRRQETEREKRIVGLLRAGEAKQALDLKRDDGSAVMVAGGYKEAIAAVAAKYVERLRETGMPPAIYAATNRDAHELSRAVRAERRALGQLGPDVMRVRAVGQAGHAYDLALAVGDKVRLFGTAKARFADGSGGRLGRNGHVLEVVSLDAEGMTARALKTGQEGAIRWADLATEAGRVHLGYGDAVTIHAGQGATRREGSILALPSGSQAIDGHDAYSALTRHTDWCCLMTSEMAEAAEVRKSRTLDDPRPVTLEDKWGNVGRHIAHQPVKDLALSLFDRATQIFRGSVLDFAPSLRLAEQRIARQEPPSHGPDHIAIRLADATARPVAASLQALGSDQEAREQRRMRVAAGMVAEGALPFAAVQDRLIAAVLADQTRGARRDIHGLPERVPGAESVDQVKERIAQELGAAVERTTEAAAHKTSVRGDRSDEPDLEL